MLCRCWWMLVRILPRLQLRFQQCTVNQGNITDRTTSLIRLLYGIKRLLRLLPLSQTLLLNTTFVVGLIIVNLNLSTLDSSTQVRQLHLNSLFASYIRQFTQF
ncbi:hypothetical protein CONLIGDRAFT_143189 [Coniochaeta ligniaria NRRL 30616]|uniref:Uncharacterized protein n=1 Tax=Coniochaeta ligniaria NRRL 30616 TaxID=1408157 RepID=A0A1J7IZV0_9PEZI|nr:hypothetical protein CONLIGDRAFT_143189 [Coniochaeta ligniaria NRRL 30616]